MRDDLRQPWLNLGIGSEPEQHVRPAVPPNPPPRPPSAGDASATTVKRRVRRAALRWLAAEWRPTGAATNVVTRIRRVRADIAAFHSRPVRNSQPEGPNRVLQPQKTLVIECFSRREGCWPDCADSNRVAPRLAELRRRKAELEADIRRDEPQLRDPNSLFEEFAEWRYEKTENRDYRALREEVDALEHGLYAGTQFERIREAALADELYLAVPQGLIEPGELADGWGLLWVDDQMQVEVMREPTPRDCLPANRLHLVQNIAAASLKSSLFAEGIREVGGEVRFVREPRGRRRAQKPSLK